MRLVGIAEGCDVLVAALDGDHATPLAEVRDFWADPQRHLSRPTGDPRPVEAITLAPPIPPSARVLCLGLNYRDHATEGDYGVPDHPTIFGRWTASLSVDGVPVPVPADEPGLDWEGEVAAVVGAPLQEATAAQAQDGVLGYAVFNDLSARRAQKLTAQWTLGKNADRSGPMGPIVTADEVGPLTDGLRLTTRVNGHVVQEGDTEDLMFGVGETLALVSRTMTLHPGDVLVTGTPAGVGYARTPPWLLGPGDVVEVEAERLGVLRTPIVGADRR
ncbi:fumarylacetoacetate hydrolase [Actinomycetospora sp. NBRC 106375]|uniref:fumarylacetoacetate hydrolase family protein n=1 Tax=Actinomycetospora sp. NBRC 106375 TaxID=3032207 RepID=UPI0024A31D78|nr:fumarylacetoacetate hydrolase family protein [Actinomycetospora sp. NBRC 106375]GLZ47082.1 fumarylacetoacetate hydrolase [Actinomycetospora sp. NBRC 106375]